MATVTVFILVILGVIGTLALSVMQFNKISDVKLGDVFIKQINPRNPWDKSTTKLAKIKDIKKNTLGEVWIKYDVYEDLNELPVQTDVMADLWLFESTGWVLLKK